MPVPVRTSRGRVATRVPVAPVHAPVPAPPVPQPPAAGKVAASQEQVAISLIDLLEQLKDHVDADKLPRLLQLKKQAVERPEEQVKLKRDILMLAGAEALRAAVGALMERSRTPPTPEPPPPPPEPPALSLWPENMSKDDFKTSLIHSFHCRTPSCPVEGCASFTAKLHRLHQHVSSCNTAGCVLCSMYSYLKYYRDSSDQSAGMPQQSSAHRYAETLLNSSQLLPRLQKGQVSWVTPTEALSQVVGPQILAGFEAAPAPECRVPTAEESGAAPRVNEGPASKRRRKNQSMPPPRAAPALSGMQGVLGTPASIAYLNSLDPASLGAGGDMLRLHDLEYEAHVGGAGGAGRGGLSMHKSLSALGGLPLTASFSGLDGQSLADMLKSNSFGGVLTPSNSFSAGLPMQKSRTKNASEMSLGTFLESTGGGIDDILSEFGPGDGSS